MRRPAVASVIAPLAVVVAVSGTAVATVGHGITLGRSNVSTRTTVLADTRGTPLRLTARHGKPPLSVHGNTTQVPSLSASLLGGLSAAALSPQRLVITKIGNTTYTVPKGFHHMLALLVGGGGGGGAGDSDAAGDGGGQGGTLQVWFPVTPGSRWTVAVGGGGGAGAHAGYFGSAGGQTYLGTKPGTYLAYASGGYGGETPPDCVNNPVVATGGDGFISSDATTAVGISTIPGGAGGLCGSSASYGFGGDSSATGGGGDGGESTSVMPTLPLSGRNGVAIVVFLR